MIYSKKHILGRKPALKDRNINGPVDQTDEIKGREQQYGRADNENKRGNKSNEILHAELYHVVNRHQAKNSPDHQEYVVDIFEYY